jgi:WXG100 family type VII secretion target
MITLDHTAFRAAVADVHTAADRLRDDRDRVAREVDGLLDGGWSGAAASAYAAGWDDWKQAAERVLAGLDTMGRLLEAAHADLARSDESSGGSLAHLTARLG